MGTVDITDKDTVLRTAAAEGSIFLRIETIRRIAAHQIKKGNPIAVAEIAALSAAKKTSELIPHCHQIPIEDIKIDFILRENQVKVTCGVKATAKTGVEMEALVGVTMTLNTIWDMVKYLEKDKDGQYPETRISDIRIIKKTKG